MKVIVFGGYGTFGTLVSRELAVPDPASAGWELVVAGRDGDRARQLAASLDCAAAVVDVSDAAACRAVLQRGDIAVNCAGPFQVLADGLTRACLDEGAHYVDIADARAWCLRVASQPWRERGLCAVYGCSSLPGVSGALAALALDRSGGEADRVRVTLFIGNRNPKGGAAVASVVGGLGRPIAGGSQSGCRVSARGFRGGVDVDLPPPFGSRRVHDLDSADRDELPVRLGFARVDVKVGFESRFATRVLALLARLGPRLGSRTARWLTSLSRLLPQSGHSGGVVMVELFAGPRLVCRASIGGPTKGQRMAVLPVVLAVREVAAGRIAAGAQPAFVALGARRLLDHLVSEGYTLTVQGATRDPIEENG